MEVSLKQQSLKAVRTELHQTRTTLFVAKPSNKTAYLIRADLFNNTQLLIKFTSKK